MTLVIQGQGATTIITGHSPALTVSSGNVVVSGVALITGTDSPTLSVSGGTLTLRQSSLDETANGSQAAIAITGGSVDLGTSAEPGQNTFNVHGLGLHIANTSGTVVTAIGNTFVADGSILASSSLIRDRILDELKPGGSGLVILDMRPIVLPDSDSVQSGTPLTMTSPGVLANDISIDGTALTAVIAGGPAHGTLSLNSDGSFTYQSSNQFVGDDQFTYQARAGDGTLSEPAVVTIRVTATPAYWINAAGGDWNNSANWDIGQVPGAGNDAVINFTGITVTHASGAATYIA